VIDVVTVSPITVQTKYGERAVAYAATLTYSYRAPDLQIGEYSRKFGAMMHDEAEAQAWVEGNRGLSVMVRVDPRDTARSVLLKQDL
jgi:hypothetical protein